MTVQRDVIGNCLVCHKAGAGHFDAQPGQCATCHVPFWEMPAGVTTRRWRRGRRRHRTRRPTSSRLTGSWRVPSSWMADSSRVPGMRDLSCAGVLHHLSRECARSPRHPGAPAGSAIARDGEPELKAPASHAATAFMTTHGRKLSKQQAAQTCGILSYGDELRGLSHGAATAGAGARGRGAWPGRRGHRGTPTAPYAWRRFH